VFSYLSVVTATQLHASCHRENVMISNFFADFYLFIICNFVICTILIIFSRNVP